MTSLATIKKIYFIGIGGIGMSAIARYFHAKQVSVSGYDKTPTALTKELESAGINIVYQDDISLAPKDVDAVVFTPAIPASHAQLNFYRQNKYTVVKRSDVLEWITNDSYNICIAGTHGKTTITSMTAHLLRDSGYGCNAFLGGIAVNYQTNFWSSPTNHVVVEADEYDRSFLKLRPNIAIISSMDADHLDIYGNATEVENAFLQFSERIKTGGCLIAKYGMKRTASFTAENLITYHLNNSKANCFTEDLKVVDGNYLFTVNFKGTLLTDVSLPMGGLHNIENALAAIAVAKYLQIDNELIRAALANFKGVRRRFEYAIKNSNQVLIDDYAHHPAELDALITGVKSLYPHEKITLVFQPHLFSRTQDQAVDFAKSLANVNELILLPIYPARELPIEGVTSDWLLEMVSLENKQVMSKTAFQNWVATHRPKLLVMAGAGDIDVEIQKTKIILNN